MLPARQIRARCPHDHGRLLLEQDPQGSYLSCLGCGYVLEECSTPVVAPDHSLPTWWCTHPA